MRLPSDHHPDDCLTAVVSHPSPGPAPVRIVIASEIRLLCDGLADALDRRMRAQVVAMVHDPASVLRAVREQAPDVLLLDMALAESLAVVRTLGTVDAPSVQVVAFSVSDRESELMACIESGVAGYVARDGTVDDAVAAIESVRRGETLCSPRLAASLFRRVAAVERARRRAAPFSAAAPPAEPGGPPDADAPLTSREREILALIERGLSNKEIGTQLGIELATVKNHVHRLLEKLRVARRGQAAARARAVTRQH